MRGLALARQYYTEHGLPMLQAEFGPELAAIAVGLVGDGSDCLGFDDELSTDHDWGPGFCCWLRQEDFARFGERLRAAYAGLPQQFQGYARKTSEWGDNRVGVFEIGAFYRGFLGRAGMPASLADWMRVPEANLAACTSGEVFCDPPGEFSRLRARLLAYYPEDVRLAKIAARCMSAGQAGQYNFHRSIQRGEHYAAQHAETKFCADAMSLVYLLNRRYAPFYKWVHRCLSTLPRLGLFMAQKVDALVVSPEYEDKKRLIADIAAAIVLELQEEGLSEAEGPFLVDHGPRVHSRIADPGLRQLNVWAG